MSSAAVSLATTQPRSSRPSTSGPDALRVAGGVQGLLVHEDQAERAAQPGQHLQRRLLGASAPGNVAISAVINEVSVVASLSPASPGSSDSVASSRSVSQSRSSRVLVRLPLWPRAMPPEAVERKVGWAFFQTLAPVVE